MTQPSPTNLSDELREKIRNILAPPYGPTYDLSASSLDDTITAITAAYAEAIRGCVPEKRRQPRKDGSIWEDWLIGYQAAIDTVLDNLKKKGLL